VTGDRGRPAVTVDVVALALADRQLHVLLVQRRYEPFAGSWALPGGFVDAGERLDEAAARELEEETGVEVPALEQLAAYGDPGRDPRRSTVTIAHLATLPELAGPAAADDAAAAEWVPVTRALGKGRARMGLAFDHARIVGDAVARVAAGLEDGRYAFGLLPPTFTLAALRGVYEAVWQVPLDPANFRRKVLGSRGFVVATADVASSGPDGGKPARRYRAGRTPRLDPPMRRPG
jgi:8-oxo-dGTP diphosphatase